MIKQKNEPLLSVIVPVYNTEKYLSKCLDSIVNQTYKNIEIIIVNDCSSGNAKSITDEYIIKDNRIKYIEHEKNKGLFHARLTGFEIASGEYISFVDSDDYISIDFYRLLINKAIEKDADIVEGRIIHENEDGYKFIQNNNDLLFDELTGEEIQQKYFAQEGLFYHWHVIWNKIYSQKVWDKCYPYYKEQEKHLIMTEDIAFSTLLFCNASKYCSIKYEGYFYTKTADASTGSNSDTKKFIKNIQDMGISFDFVEHYLNKVNLYNKHHKHIYNWKKSYFRLWANRLKSEILAPLKKKKLLSELKKSFRMFDIEPACSKDHFHGVITTPWDSRYELLKQKIANKDFEYVSFDIFDTLIVRPFLEPQDLFVLLDDYFHNIQSNNKFLEFSQIRTLAEDKVRQLTAISKPSWQDININEIYSYIASNFSIEKDIIEKMKAKEIELEIQCLSRRDSIYELYKMAQALNKKIIIISDMYLPFEVIQTILQSSGYYNYERLYVSSETRLLKHTGDMFKYVVSDLSIEPSKILHIGDNWHSDKLMAEAVGIHSFFIAKPVDLLLNKLVDKETGGNVKKFLDDKCCGYMLGEGRQFFAIRCMLGVVANKIFDHPYLSFNESSDFNADPYFIGYYALGMHMFSLCKWIIEDALKKDIAEIHFVARDGYLPKMAYDVLSACYQNSPRSNYLYASRKSLLPYLWASNNQYSLDSFAPIGLHTPKSILNLFAQFLRDEFKETDLECKGFILSKTFSSKYEFIVFIDALTEEIDNEKINHYVHNIKLYMDENIGEAASIFDLGYSARLHTVITDIIQKDCSAYFVHTSGETPWRFARRNNFELNTFYESKPQISGIVRELIFAEAGPSCIGYKRNGDIVTPVFEPHQNEHINELIVSTMQKACLDFIFDMVKCFKNNIPYFKIRNAEVSIPFETYIHSSHVMDRFMFSHAYVDDVVYSGKDNHNLLAWWDKELNNIGNYSQDKDLSHFRHSYPYNFLLNKSKLLKFVFFALFDRYTLKVKVKDKYAGKKKTLTCLSVLYRILRTTKNVLKKDKEYVEIGK